MFPRAPLAAICLALAGSLASAEAPKPAAPPKEAGQVDPKQFKTVCETADVIVVGKAFAVLTATLDSDPPTPVYTSAQLETTGLKFLKGREKVGPRPESRVADAFAELGQASDLLMGKTLIVAFKWDGKNPKLVMLSATDAGDLGMIFEKYPAAK